MNFSSAIVDPETKKNINLWLNGEYDEKTKEEIRTLVEQQPKEALDAFYTHLSFGTGGMRGLMGVGSNRMNVYTVRAATQGLANYLNQQPPPPWGHSAFIGFDSRNYSHTFAEEAAKVLAGNGIRAFLCKELRPTPLVSFGCRFKRCTTGIMFTASHNPPEYNGYKVYWADGGQVLPPHDLGIMEEAAKITDPSMVKMASSLNDPLITLVSDEVDDAYLVEGSKLQYYPEENKRFGKDLKIVYTSLHGTGITLFPKMLEAWGFTNITYVTQQIIPDGNFPTVRFPNPEDKAALTLGIEKLKETKGDLLIATDPDADRVGVAVLHEEEIVLINGNQMACICLAHVCETLTRQAKMPQQAAFIKSIVTTELFQAICDDYAKPCINVLSGFKYIAEKIHQWESDPHGYTYVFGGEESYGYLLGTLTRDKDAIIISALICQVALHAKRQGKTLIDLLHDLYRKHGVFVEGLLSINFEESKAGKEKMQLCTAKLRKHLPREIGGIQVLAVEDYLSSTATNSLTGKTTKLTLPRSDVLLFWLADRSKLMVRPSGTEPKVKLYGGVIESHDHSIATAEQKGQAKLDFLLDTLKKLILDSSP